MSETSFNPEHTLMLRLTCWLMLNSKNIEDSTRLRESPVCGPAWPMEEIHQHQYLSFLFQLQFCIWFELRATNATHKMPFVLIFTVHPNKLLTASLSLLGSCCLNAPKEAKKLTNSLTCDPVTVCEDISWPSEGCQAAACRLVSVHKCVSSLRGSWHWQVSWLWSDSEFWAMRNAD